MRRIGRIRIRHARRMPTTERCGECEGCLRYFQGIVDRDRPGHAWSVVLGHLVYMEDLLMEKWLGRHLLENEAVIHRDANPLNNTRENLELVTLPDEKT
jgi:hypothetical protein